MNKYIVLSLSALVIFFTSCATTKRTYPAAFYQCEKCGETFEISKSIDEQNLSCPDKTCGGKLVKVASYKRYGSGLNTRYGYSDPWSVGYSGPYVNRRSFFGMGFHGGGHHHHHHYHESKPSKPSNPKPRSTARTVQNKTIPSTSSNNSGNEIGSSRTVQGRSIQSSSSNNSSQSRSPSRTVQSRSIQSSSSRSSGSGKNSSRTIQSKSSD